MISEVTCVALEANLSHQRISFGLRPSLYRSGSKARLNQSECTSNTSYNEDNTAVRTMLTLQHQNVSHLH